MLALTSMRTSLSRSGVARTSWIRASNDVLSGSSPHSLGQDREFVATQPSDEIAFPDDLAKVTGHLDEQQITRGVPQRVVDLLEMVEVDEDDGDRRGVGLAARAGEPTGEQGSVRSFAALIAASGLLVALVTVAGAGVKFG